VEAVSTEILPPPGDWNRAVEHSNAYPTHILGPYEDDDGHVQMICDGDGDRYEPSNCDFDTGRRPG
jgi:hypothetical protein